MAVSKTKAKRIKSDKKVDASIKKGMKKLEELQVRLGMQPEAKPVETPEPERETALSKIKKLSIEYIDAAMQAFDSDNLYKTASIAERIEVIRSRLFYVSTAKAYEMGLRSSGHDSSDLADIAGQLRAIAAVWDGDDSKFRKAEEDQYNDLMSFLDA